MIDSALISKIIGPTKLHWQLSKDWNSKTKDHREIIRQEVAKSLSPLDAETRQHILDLKVLPKATGFDISISHCPALGGFAWVQAPFLIGLDIEQISRVRTEHVLMVSTEHELKLAGSAVHLWVIKESCFKVFSKAFNVNVASQVELLSFSTSGDVSEFRATAKNIPQSGGNGWLFKMQECMVALFFLKT